jgi:hypothetical protein
MFRFVFRHQYGVTSILPIVGIYAMALVAIGVAIWRIAVNPQQRVKDEDEVYPFMGKVAASKGTGVAKRSATRRQMGAESQVGVEQCLPRLCDQESAV